MRIGPECAFRVDAPMRIEANRMRIQFAFVDKCGQAFICNDFKVDPSMLITDIYPAQMPSFNPG